MKKIKSDAFGFWIKSNVSKSPRSKITPSGFWLNGGKPLNVNNKKVKAIVVPFMGDNSVMHPTKFFKKESIKSKHLSKWGDADMDGTSNWLDCDPRKANKDGMFSALGAALRSKITFGKSKKVNEDKNYLTDRTALDKKLKKFDDEADKLKAKPTFKQLTVNAATKVGSTISSGVKSLSPSRIKEGYGSWKKSNREAKIEKFMNSPQGENLKVSQMLPGKHITSYGAYKNIEAEGDSTQKFGRKYNLIEGKVYSKAGAIASSLAGGISGLQASIAPSAYIQTLERARLVKATKSSNPTKRLNALKLLREHDLSASKRSTKATKKFTSAVVSAVLPAGTVYTSSGGKGKGYGPTSKYAQWGGVYKYRQWLSKQNELRRLNGLPSINRSVDPAEATRMINESRSSMRVTELGSPGDKFSQMAPKQYAQQSATAPSATPEAYAVEPDSQSSQYQEQPQQYQQTSKPQYAENEEDMSMMNVTPDMIRRAAQLDAQKNDQILNAPQFMKGQLKNVGDQNSMTYTLPQENIINAPNFVQGQLRHLGKKSNPAVRVGPPPINNPYGDDYIEIDPISGKQMVMKRHREKWLYQGDEFGQFNVNKKSPYLQQAARQQLANQQAQRAQQEYANSNETQNQYRTNRPQAVVPTQTQQPQRPQDYVNSDSTEE